MKLEKDWKTRLAEAKARGHFTEDDKDKISNFATCFIGEHYDRRIPSRQLRTEELVLGSMAEGAVHLDLVLRARKIYEEVQRLYQ